MTARISYRQFIVTNWRISSIGISTREQESFVWLGSTDYLVVITLPIMHSSFYVFKNRFWTTKRCFSVPCSESLTSIGPKTWHLSSPSSLQGWRWQPRAWSKTPQRQHRTPATPVKSETSLLYLSHFWLYLDRHLHHAVTPRDDTLLLICLQTSALEEKLVFRQQSQIPREFFS